MNDYSNHQRLMLLIFEAIERGFRISTTTFNGETVVGDTDKIAVIKAEYDNFLIGKGLVQNDE